MRPTTRSRSGRTSIAGHSLPEAMISVTLVGMMMVSLYAGFSSGFSTVRSARENVQATEILNRHAERLRLYTWDQLLDTNQFLRPTFAETYCACGEDGANTNSIVFQGTVSLDIPTELPAAYRDQMRLVTISLTWSNTSSGQTQLRHRQLQTYVAKYGIQNYVVGP